MTSSGKSLASTCKLHEKAKTYSWIRPDRTSITCFSRDPSHIRLCRYTTENIDWNLDLLFYRIARSTDCSMIVRCIGRGQGKGTYQCAKSDIYEIQLGIFIAWGWNALMISNKQFLIDLIPFSYYHTCRVMSQILQAMRHRYRALWHHEAFEDFSCKYKISESPCNLKFHSSCDLQRFCKMSSIPMQICETETASGLKLSYSTADWNISYAVQCQVPSCYSSEKSHISIRG